MLGKAPLIKVISDKFAAEYTSYLIFFGRGVASTENEFFRPISTRFCFLFQHFDLIPVPSLKRVSCLLGVDFNPLQ